MFDIWGFLLQTLTASGVAVLLLVIKALFKDKLPPKWHFAVWSVLGLVLLIPAGITGRYTLFNWQMVIEAIKTLVGDYSFSRVFFPIPIITSVPKTIAEWIFAIYVIGVIAHIIKYFVSYARLRITLKKGVAPSDEVVDRIRQIAQGQKVKIRKIVELEGISGAFVCGVLSPVLVIPAGKEVDDKVILHEILHLKYKDTFWSIVICFLRSIHWCNPLLIYCGNLAVNDMESRCDQHVLEQLEGEERREYGHILLSMINERFEKTPCSTSLNNGGNNIRKRIEAIARFKKYPAGMKLVSICAIIVLALSLSFGVQASTVDDSIYDSMRLSVASARSIRCTTLAGAFDTYGKAILDQNGIYRIMCAPEAMQKELAEEMLEMERIRVYSNWDCGLDSWPDTYNGYYIYNLKETGDNAYEATLVIKLNYPPDGQPEEDGKIYLAYQNIRAEKENGRWVVTPSEEFQYTATEEVWLEYGCNALPAISYTGTADKFKIDMRFQTIHLVDNKIQSNDSFSSMFGNSYTYNTTPKPNAEFTHFYDGRRTLCTHLGTQEERESILKLGISTASVYPGEEKPEDLTAAIGSAVSGSDSNGRSWGTRTTFDDWGPTIELNNGGGGGGGTFTSMIENGFPEYFVADFYVNDELYAEMELYPEEEVAK